MSRYAKIRRIDISNGPGIRVSIFFQGCNFLCKDCFNSELWSFDGGNEYTEETKEKILNLCDKNHIAGLSILGGEPLHKNNLDDLLKLVKDFKNRFPNKTIWLWTGFSIKSLLNNKNKRREILDYVDFVVDGRFAKTKKDPRLLYRGSSNQIIWENINNEWIVSNLNNRHKDENSNS